MYLCTLTNRLVPLFLIMSLALATVTTPVSAEQDNEPGTMVWRIRPKMGIVEKAIDSISGLLATEVAKYTKGAVISEEDVQTVLRTSEQRMRCDGGGTVCMAELGNALGVPEVVAGDLGMVGDFWILNLRRIDVRHVRVIKRVSLQVNASINDIILALPGLVARLYEQGADQGEVPVRGENAEAASNDGTGLRVQREESPSGYTISGWTATGTGIGMLVLGAVGTAMALQTGSDHTRTAEQDNRMWSDMAIAGYSVGAALVAMGVLLLILDPGPRDTREEDTVAQGKWDFGFAPRKGGFSVMLGGRW